MSRIKIECANCEAVKEHAHSSFKDYFGKRVGVICKKCNYKTEVLVDADFFNKDLISVRSLFETHVIDDGVELRKDIEQYFLVVLKNDKTPDQKLKLKLGENIIGRISKNNIPANKISIESEDKEMSRIHCMITLEEVGNRIDVILKDHDSTNGVYLNGSDTKISSFDEIYLEAEDIIRIGKTKFKVSK